MKCDLLFHYRDAKKISFYYFGDTKLCAKHEKTREFHLYRWDHDCKVNEWCLVDCFHREFKVPTQIMVRDYCIAKYKMLMSFRTIFFVIQNIHVNSNPGPLLMEGNMYDQDCVDVYRVYNIIDDGNPLYEFISRIGTKKGQV